jgi:D-3-phosphoglycerate dehydrogenase / 2-oxoglutarate reductase
MVTKTLAKWEQKTPNSLANTLLVIDFDSTFLEEESLDVLAKMLLSHPENAGTLEEFLHVTASGMEGNMSFCESLKWRIKHLDISKKHLEDLIELLKNKITPSFKRNRDFIKTYSDQIYILSGGFKEIITPIVAEFGISEEHVFANTFIFNEDGIATGFDMTNPLAHDKGKVTCIKQLKFSKDVVMIGDGMTDYEVKELDIVKKFFAFTENIRRDAVVRVADCVVEDFESFLNIQGWGESASSLKNTMGKVLLLENINPQASIFFQERGFEVECFPGGLEEEELIKRLKGVKLLGIRSKTRLTKAIFDQAPDLLAVGAFCIGVNQVDLQAATLSGVPVFNAPFSNTRSVVELAVGMIIMLLRKIFSKNAAMHQGRWDKTLDNAVEIRGKTLGIIGYGNIGSQLSVLAEALGMQVIYYDIADKLPLGNAQPCNSLKNLLHRSDVVSVHVDGSEKNQNIISEEELQQMKDGSVLINLSRGHVVDLEALKKWLDLGKLSGAALDVYPQEPKNSKDEFVNALQGMENVVLTPHIGGNTFEAQKNIAKTVTNRLQSYITTGTTMRSVNFPELNVEEVKGTHRFIHIHHNIPGVLAEISGILAKYQINIEGQFLKTNESLGVVITDVASKYHPDLLEDLEAIKATVSLRVLY